MCGEKKAAVFFASKKLRKKKKKLWTNPLFYSYIMGFPNQRKKRGPTPDMCVISKNYLLYVKRQIHGQNSHTDQFTL